MHRTEILVLIDENDRSKKQRQKDTRNELL